MDGEISTVMCLNLFIFCLFDGLVFKQCQEPTEPGKQEEQFAGLPVESGIPAYLNYRQVGV